MTNSAPPVKRGDVLLMVWGGIACIVLASWVFLFLLGRLSRNDQEPVDVAKKAAIPAAETAIQISEGIVFRPSGTSTQTPISEQTGANWHSVPEEIKEQFKRAHYKEAVPMLIEFLAHPHSGVRDRAAVELAGRDPVLAAVAPLLKLLHDPVLLVRIEAALALGTHGSEDPKAISALGAALRNDPSRRVRYAAAKSLRALGTGDAARATAVAAELIPALRDARQGDQGLVAMAFGPLGAAGQPAIPQLLLLLKQDQGTPEIAGALAELGHIDPLKALVVANRLDQSSIRTSIAKGLGRQRNMNPAMIQLLQVVYQDGDAVVRCRAVEALGTCEPTLPEAIPLIERAQSDSDDRVRAAAAEALAKYVTRGDSFEHSTSM